MIGRLAILVVALSPAAVSAQQAASSWPGLDPSRLPTVYVLDKSGTETAGKLLRLNPDSLVLLVDGAERQFESARVARIQKRGDSLRNGAIIGAVVGVALGILTAGIADCPGDNPGGGCAGSRAALLLVSTGAYSLTGIAIDALIPGRTTLYEAPKAPSSANRSGSAAVNFSVRW